MAAPSNDPFNWTLGVYGARLVDPELLGGASAHEVTPIPYLANQISSQAELTYNDVSREVEVSFAQDSLTGGCASNPHFNLERQNQFLWSKGVDTSFPDYILPPPKITTIGATISNKPTMAVQRGNITYVAAGADLYQITNSTTRTLDVTFAATITDLLVWDGNIIVGLGSSTNFRYRTSDTLTGAFTDGTVPAHFFTTESYRLWRAVQPNSIMVADNVAGPWSTYEVGDSSFNITSLDAVGDSFYIGKENGPHEFNAEYVALAIVPDLRIQADAQVCKVTQVFNGDYAFTTRRGIVLLRAGEGLMNIGLDMLADPALPGSPPEPRPTAMTTDGRFLYALVVSGNGMYIWKYDGRAWHNYIWRSDLGASSDLLFATSKLGSTATNAILFAYSSGGNWQLAYGLWPSTVDPTKDTNYQFDTTVDTNLAFPKLRTLRYTANLPTAKKFTSRAKVLGENFSSARYVTVSLIPDASTTARTLTPFRVSPFSENKLGQTLPFYSMQVELLFNTEATNAPRVQAFEMPASFIFRVVRRHVCQFLSSSFTPLQTGGRARGSGAEVIDTFRKLREEQTLIDCKDEDGRLFEAQLDDISERTIQVRQGLGFEPVKVITAVLKEVVT